MKGGGHVGLEAKMSSGSRISELKFNKRFVNIHDHFDELMSFLYQTKVQTQDIPPVCVSFLSNVPSHYL